MQRRRSTAVTVSLVAALSVTMTGCSSGSGTDYNGVCIDKVTQKRIDDTQCKNGSGGHGWVYYRSGVSVPAVGSDARSGLGAVPKGASAVRGGVSAKGGVVARGGFGGGAHGGGEVGG